MKAFLKIPSISTDPKYKKDMNRAVTWLSKKFNALNASQVKVHKTPGHPIITAQFGNDDTKPTVLVYGHYDVQPPGKLHLWKTPPFEPDIRDNKIYARGATDDKGQVFTYLKAIEIMNKEGDLPCNIRFLIEGSEEISSKDLPEFLKENLEIISECDAAVISDTAIIDEETPSITVGLRGHTRVRLTVKGPKKELHSGVHGGAVANPLEALSKMIAKITNEDGKITIPNFYDDVRKLSKEDRERINGNSQDNFDQVTLAETGAPALVGEKGYSSRERVGIRPAFTVLSIHGGPESTNLKDVISPDAVAMLAIRTVANQNPVEVGENLRKYLTTNAPEGVEVHTEILGASSPWALSSFSDPAYKAAEIAYETVWGKKPVPVFCGGSIPIAAILETAGISPTFLGFGLDSDNMHAANEHISIERFQKGIETLVHFFRTFPQKHAENNLEP